jgi:phenylacetate-CoA ligase
MGVLAEGQCECGRGLPRIREILGRTCDMIVTPEGVVCSGIMMPHFMKEFSSVKEFQFLQQSVDHLTLRLVPGDGWSPERRDYMEQELRRWVGPTMEVQFEETDRLETHGSGKYRMVVSDVPIDGTAMAR